MRHTIRIGYSWVKYRQHNVGGGHNWDSRRRLPRRVWRPDRIRKHFRADKRQRL
jgi:hypothetical protein